MTAIRYGLGRASPSWAILAAVEGRGYSGSTAVFGGAGSSSARSASPASTSSSFVGLEHTTPQGAAIIVATMPLITALVLWARGGARRPARSTMIAIAVAHLRRRRASS